MNLNAAERRKHRVDAYCGIGILIVYSEFYEEGYRKGYAAGEEDTNDGDYRSGFDDSNPYTGQSASDYCLGYEQGYEDAYEEIIDTSDDEEEPI